MLDNILQDAQDILEMVSVRRNECPKCGTPLYHFSGLERIPEFLYCPMCNDQAWNYEGKRLFPIEN